MCMTAAWELPLQTLWRRCLPPIWFILVIISLTCCYFQTNWCLKKQSHPCPRIDLTSAHSSHKESKVASGQCCYSPVSSVSAYTWMSHSIKSVYLCHTRTQGLPVCSATWPATGLCRLLRSCDSISATIKEVQQSEHACCENALD